MWSRSWACWYQASQESASIAGRRRRFPEHVITFGSFYLVEWLNIMAHVTYQAIVMAIRAGTLTEPFSKQDFRNACPGLGEGTYNAFLWKHAKGNGQTTELFDGVAPG